jgi:hypothetical protein
MPEQQQKEQGAGMPQVDTTLLVADDYVYEPKPPEKREGKGGQQTQSGGMSNQFEIVSSALNKNL